MAADEADFFELLHVHHALLEDSRTKQQRQPLRQEGESRDVLSKGRRGPADLEDLGPVHGVQEAEFLHVHLDAGLRQVVLPVCQRDLRVICFRTDVSVHFFEEVLQVLSRETREVLYLNHSDLSEVFNQEQTAFRMLLALLLALLELHHLQLLLERLDYVYLEVEELLASETLLAIITHVRLVIVLNQRLVCLVANFF